MPSIFLVAVISLLSPVLSYGSGFYPRSHKSINCTGALSRKGHQPRVQIGPLNETDLALWKASGQGNQEVGVVELVSTEGKILAATDFVYQAHDGNIIRTNVHVPIKDALIEFIQKIDNSPQASAIRCTHVHPKILTTSGVIHIGPIWLFSPSDKQAGYLIKFLMEQTKFSNLSMEMHLIYQTPFARQPKKKMYVIESQYTWANGDYSL